MSECEKDAKYHATFLAYRPINRNYTSTELSVVPESIKSISVGCQNRSKVKCGKEILLSSERFVIQENDILAVCLPAERENQLQLVSRKYDEDDDDEGREGILYQHSEVEFDCEKYKLQTVNTQDITARPYLQLHLQAEVAAANGQISIMTDPNHSLRLNGHQKQEEWYLKVIPASIAGLVILALVFVVIVTCIALKRRRTLSRSPGHSTTAVCNPIGYTTQARYAAESDMNNYTIDDNVAYSIPITNLRCTPQLHDEHIYEIV
jgi:hypothetical protein